MSECRRYRVHGRVQGVWFRGSTRRQARQLGLTGWVRNCSDGSVEVLACGHPSAIAQLGRWLKRGPDLARVERVDESDETSEVRYTDFFIH